MKKPQTLWNVRIVDSYVGIWIMFTGTGHNESILSGLESGARKGRIRDFAEIVKRKSLIS